MLRVRDCLSVCASSTSATTGMPVHLGKWRSSRQHKVDGGIHSEHDHNDSGALRDLVDDLLDANGNYDTAVNAGAGVDSGTHTEYDNNDGLVGDLLNDLVGEDLLEDHGNN